MFELKKELNFFHSILGHSLFDMKAAVNQCKCQCWLQDPASGMDYSRVKQRPTCVLQYIIFPPHMKTSLDG